MTCYYKASYDDGKLSVSVDANTINLFYKGQDQELTDQPDLLCHALDTLIEAQAKLDAMSEIVSCLEIPDDSGLTKTSKIVNNTCQNVQGGVDLDGPDQLSQNLYGQA